MRCAPARNTMSWRVVRNAEFFLNRLVLIMFVLPGMIIYSPKVDRVNPEGSAVVY
jgi:hypothetical protein